MYMSRSLGLVKQSFIRSVYLNKVIVTSESFLTIHVSCLDFLYQHTNRLTGSGLPACPALTTLSTHQLRQLQAESNCFDQMAVVTVIQLTLKLGK